MATNPTDPVNLDAFRTYDVRGFYPTQVNEKLAYLVGRTFVSHLGCKTVSVGMDARLSSPSLRDELVRGITDQGADVFDVGLCTTPMLNFSVVNYRHDAGVMVSASHNPPEYNGFKLIKNPVIQIYNGTGMEKMKEIIQENRFSEPESKGRIFKDYCLDDYITHVLGSAGRIKGLKVVCDYGNGAGSISALGFFKRLEGDTCAIHLYPEPDGAYPNHHPNPHNLENMDELRGRVVQEKADLGVFFDGDADRSHIIDDLGDIIFPDIILALLAPRELENRKGGNVYFDLRSSKVVAERITDLGGIPVMMRVGNPFYKEKMINEKGVIGGEFSGHMMFSDNYGMDDGLFAVAKVMSFLTFSGNKLSELVKPLRVYHQTPEINIRITDISQVDSILKAVEEEFKGENMMYLDGLSVDSVDNREISSGPGQSLGDSGWWFNLRGSNTEPFVRLRIEAKEESKIDELQARITRTIDSVS